ncbi:MAG TPA: VWA domain-containing protein [Thermoanaerobaculia bacterium]|nr:VWA domain-containing protein [Thermoanaerobaculia bacterium]
MKTITPLVPLLLAALLILPAVPGVVGSSAAQEPPAGVEAAQARLAAVRAEDAEADEDPPAEDPAFAGPAAQPGDLEVFVDTVDVRVVNVDVYVTDKKGNPVTGLTIDDFEVREDRRPVEVTNFYAVEGGRRVDEPEPVAVPAPVGAPTPPPGAPPPVPADQRLHLVVYIDNFNIEPLNRNRVMNELGFFLTRRLSPGDRVMVLTYDRSLNVRQPFTTDHELLVRSLDEIKRISGHAVSRSQERREALERISESEGPTRAAQHARMYAQSVENDLRFTVGALKETVQNLAGLPGRKAVLYVSDGVPMVPGQDAFHAVEAKFGPGHSVMTESFTFDHSRSFRELANLANANRVTFYTLDAAGLRVNSAFSAEHSAGMTGVLVESSFNTNLQAPLRYIADTTGGVAIVNTNSVLPALERVGADFNSYYSLGFRPATGGMGRYHRIEVVVKGRRDLVVRHREGYRDKTTEAQMTEGTVAAMQFGFEDNPLAVRVSFGDVSRRDDRFFTVPVSVEVPLDSVVLVPRAGTHEARLRLYISALDDRGDSSPVQQVAVPISIPSDEIEAARGQTYRYTVPLLMRSGRHRVAVGVRDELGAEEAFVTSEIMVGRG